MVGPNVKGTSESLYHTPGSVVAAGGAKDGYGPAVKCSIIDMNKLL